MRCSNCGFENPPGLRFCGNCATSLQSPPSVEERKLVTVLFADVVASTELSGAIDPEQLRARMTKFFSIAREEIERYGGTVEKFIGDAVMAVFGLPAVREDDPERAGRAAVSIWSMMRPEVQAGSFSEIRIGINTGEVVANPQAVEKGQFLVTGEVVNLAARLQQHAQPGQILVGERTMAALRGIAQMRAVPPLIAKGAAAPLTAWELLKVSPARERELRATSFVGREEELDLLAGYLRRMGREGRGHVVTILGSAGVGKTRLAQEFRMRFEGLHILRGRAVPYGIGVPFWALGEVIREKCGILFGDPLEIARRKLQETAAQLDVAEATPALLAVLGLGSEGAELTREALFRGMRAFLQALAQRTPLLLILEDMHVAEDVTLDVLEHTADWIREVPLFLLVLARPELLDRRPAWMGGKRSAATLFLDPLSGGESRELAQAILGGKKAPEALFGLVLERAEGNPLFVEEMLRALIDGGVLVQEAEAWKLTVPLGQVTVPDTVHAVVAARVDALPSHEKQILQAAALHGKDFWLGGLHIVAEEDHIEKAIGALVSKELVIPKRRSTLAGEQEFTFRHILIRDVAYATIPKAQRWPQHAKVAQWMQQIAEDRRAEFADIIAHHWLQVLALQKDLGLLPDPHAREQAIENLLLAGQRAASVYANTTARDHYSRILDQEPVPDVRLQALLGRGDVWMLLGQFERAREDFAAVRALARETGQPRVEAVALDRLGHSFRQQDKIALALEHLEPALGLSREVGDPALTGRILNHIGFTYFSGSRHKEAILAHEEARRLLEGCGDVVGLAASLHGLGENLVLKGQIPASIRWLSESAKMSEKVGNRSLAGENHYMIAIARWLLGDYTDAQAEAHRSVITLAEIGDAWNSSFALGVGARIAITLGEFGTALEYARRGLDLARQIGAVRPAVRTLVSLGMVYRELEDYPGAWQADHEAAELGRTTETGLFTQPEVLSMMALDAAALGRIDDVMAYIGDARRVLNESEPRVDYPEQVTHAEGRVLLAMGKPAEARTAAKILLGLIDETGIVLWRMPALRLCADASSALGDHGAAIPIYLAAAEEAERTGRVPALWRTLAGLAEAQKALGRAAEAATCARRAREIVDRLAATVPDERLRALFLQSSKVQRIISLGST